MASFDNDDYTNWYESASDDKIIAELVKNKDDKLWIAWTTLGLESSKRYTKDQCVEIRKLFLTKEQLDSFWRVSNL